MLAYRLPGLNAPVAEIDRAITLEHAKDEGLARGTATSLAAHASSAEIRLIHLDLVAEERLVLTFFGDTLSDSEKDRVDCLPVSFATLEALKSSASDARRRKAPISRRKCVANSISRRIICGACCPA